MVRRSSSIQTGTFVAAIFLTMAGTIAQPRPEGGTISGTVNDEDGMPVEGVAVRLSKLSALNLRQDERTGTKDQGISRVVRTGKGGKYAFFLLPGGSYSVCAEDEGPQAISSCMWEGVATVDLKAGEVRENLVRRTLEGTRIRVRILDTNRRTSATPGRHSGPQQRDPLAVMVSAGSFIHPARLRPNSSPDVYEFELTIPRRLQVRLHVRSHLEVADEAGRALPDARATGLAVEKSKPGQSVINLQLR